MGVYLSYCDFSEPGPEARWSEAARSTVTSGGFRAGGVVVGVCAKGVWSFVPNAQQAHG